VVFHWQGWSRLTLTLIDPYLRRNMPVTCMHCNQTSNRFSAAEYRAGTSGSECICKDCQKGMPRCLICTQVFEGHNLSAGLNQLKEHAVVHQAKTVQCPVCRDENKKFRSAADAVLHLESGYCPSCRGKDNAKNNIYKFITTNANHLTSSHLMIQDGSAGVPDLAYRCQSCSKCFNNLSQMMQHSSSKHGTRHNVW